MKKLIETERIAAAVGPFSPGVEAGGFIFLSGQIALDRNGKLIEGDVSSQTDQVFTNLNALLDAAGRSFDDVVRAGVFLTDMRDFGAVNTVYARYFSPPYPARTTVAVAALPLGAAVEIDLVVRA